MNFPPRLQRAVLPLLSVIFLVPLLIYGIGTVYMRFMADDFCTFNLARDQGLLAANVFFFTNWSGRFVGMFLSIGGLLAGTVIVVAMTAVLLVIWWIALVYVMWFAARLRIWPQPAWFAVGAASLLMLATLSSMFSLVQTVYWISGSMLYLAPVVFLTAYLAFLARQSGLVQPPLPRWLAVLLAVLLPVLAAGCVEIAGLIQVMVLIPLYVVCTRWTPLRRLSPFVLVGLVASLITFVVTVAAPGNFVRLAAVTTPTRDIPVTLVGSALGPAMTLLAVIRYWPVGPFVLVLLPALAGYYFEHQRLAASRWWLLLTPLVTYALAAATFVIPFYATHNPPPERVWIIPQAILFGGLLVWSYMVGWSLRSRQANRNRAGGRRLALACVAVILVLAFVTTSAKALEEVQQLKAYAEGWDRRAAELSARQESADTVVVAPLPDLGLNDMTTDNFSGKQCIAQYYGVKTLLPVQ